MNAHAHASPSPADIASHPQSPGIPSIDREELGDQLRRCVHDRLGWFSLLCVVDAVHGFVMPRLITMVLVVTVVLYLGVRAV